MPVDPSAVRDAILLWSAGHGVLAHTEQPPRAEGVDQSLNPFTDEHAEYFRGSRQIVRISVTQGTVPIITVFSRLKIAEAKIADLKNSFSKRFKGEKLTLRIETSTPFKIDQRVESYGQFEPILRHEGRIACGSSLGLGNQRNAGTFTALARKQGDNRMLGISCNHVTGGCNTARPGTPVVVPGIQDVSTDYPEINIIGHHDITAPMSQGIPSVFKISTNRDLAVFEIPDPSLVSAQQGYGADSYPTPTRFAGVKVGLEVKKWGRSTGFTRGKIKAIETDPVPLEYDVTSYYGPENAQRFQGTIYYGEVYRIRPTSRVFSLKGDSGALVVTDETGKEKVVGMIVAGNKTESLVLPLQAVLKELKLKLVPKDP